MGNVVRRFIGRGLGTIRTKPAKETPNILHKMIEREAQGKEDFDLIFRNEIYVTETLMNVMTSY